MAIHAIFDGKVFIPKDKVDLEPNTHCEIVVSKETGHMSQSADLWDLLEELAGTIEGPEDWSVEHDHYLYGTPKRSERGKQGDRSWQKNLDCMI